MMTIGKVTEMLEAARNPPQQQPPNINVVVNMPGKGTVHAVPQPDGSIVMTEASPSESLGTTNG
jgi:hypothetical protein